jgi:hypothetical protein
VPPALLALRRIGPTKGFLIALAVVLVGFLAPGWAGAVVLLLIVAALAALLAQTWPVTPAGARALRLAVLALLVVVAVAKVN